MQREEKERGLIGDEQEEEGKWKSKAMGGEDGQDGEREKRWVGRKKVAMEEKVGMGGRRWQEEERKRSKIREGLMIRASRLVQSCESGHFAES